MAEPTDGHDHDNAWTGIFVAIVLVCGLAIGTLIGQQHQFQVIYDRVGEMQRQLECPPGELLVADHDGVEYCLDPAEESE